MSHRRYRTAIIGFGKIGAEYADDPVMALHYPVATHAQALADHPDFEWQAIVDPRPESRRLARDRWHVPMAFASVEQLAHEAPPEVAVIATPPESRAEIIECLPGLQAVIVEKPLGRTLDEAIAFVRICAERNIQVQVNYWRRADDDFRALAAGGMVEAIGQPQAVFGVYGNGLRNNGSHMIDFSRMLFGEIATVQAAAGVVRHRAAPIEGDIDVPFQLVFESGLCAMFQPVDFVDYRENGLDIWGKHGRLQILQEGLRLIHAARIPNRAMQGEWEIASDAPSIRTSTVGQAFRRLYDHTARMLDSSEAPVSSVDSALRTEAAVEAIMRSLAKGGARQTLASGAR